MDDEAARVGAESYPTGPDGGVGAGAIGAEVGVGKGLLTDEAL